MSEQTLLAAIGVINAVGVVIVAIIHAFRVPYRESAAREQVMAAKSIALTRQRIDAHDSPQLGGEYSHGGTGPSDVPQ